MLKTAGISSIGASSAKCEIYDEAICACGEAPLWHPIREQLYWVDITHHKILTRLNGETSTIQFNEFVTALAWVDKDHLLAATETSLTVLNVITQEKRVLCALESDSHETRSNDGRADPWGGFWISTMGKEAQKGLGKIYRFYEDQLHVVVPSISIPNAICFDPVRARAYFADTMTKKVYVMELDSQTGQPISAPTIFKDFSNLNQAIDGGVVDKNGDLWLGVWDGKHILKVNPEGEIIERFLTGADRPTCPAFGGPSHADLFVTTAAIGLEDSLSTTPEQGKTLIFRDVAKGEPAPCFSLPASFQSEC